MIMPFTHLPPPQQVLLCSDLLSFVYYPPLLSHRSSDLRQACRQFVGK